MPLADLAPSGLWAALLPPDVVAVETRRFNHSPLLYPDERSAVGRAIPKRIEEFAAGRACAREAMEWLGIAPGPLLRGADRRPGWPAGVIGSITHTEGYCAAAVAWASAYLGLGIDVERNGRLTEALQRRICTGRELDRLGDLDADARQKAATVIFSAKEAFYKSQSALAGAVIEFHDVELQLHEGVFVVEPLRRLPAVLDGVSLSGRYAVEGELVFTGIALAAP